MQGKVVVTDYGFADLIKERTAAEAAGACFTAFSARTAEEVAAVLEGATVGVVQFAPVSADAIGRMAPGATLIRYGAGYDNIDLAAAKARGFRLAYVPDYCTQEVADHTAALVTALLRQIVPLDTSVRKLEWSVIKTAPAIRPPEDVTIGFLGVGRIGRETMKRLAPYGFRFTFFDPFAPHIEGAVRCADREALFAVTDMLVLHLPLTADSRHVVNEERMRLMPKGAFVVNTARGGLVDETALIAMIEAGHIAGSALDVFEHEPLPAESPLRHCPNILLSPHAAWYSNKALDRLQQLVADEIGRALAGEMPRCPIPAYTNARRG